MKSLIVGLLAAMLVIGAVPARADTVAIDSVLGANTDPIQITSGVVAVYPDDIGSFTLAGADFNAGGAVLTGFMHAFTPGMSSFSESLTLDSQGGGFVTSGGTTFSTTSPTAIVGPLSFTTAEFPVPLPTPGQTAYSLVAPFTATGQLTTSSGLSFDLTGQGTVTIGGQIADVNGLLSYGPDRSEVLTFSAGTTSPTPEPASLLLLSAGLLGGAIVRRRTVF